MRFRLEKCNIKGKIGDYLSGEETNDRKLLEGLPVSRDTFKDFNVSFKGNLVPGNALRFTRQDSRVPSESSSFLPPIPWKRGRASFHSEVQNAILFL